MNKNSFGVDLMSLIFKLKYEKLGSFSAQEKKELTLINQSKTHGQFPSVRIIINRIPHHFEPFIIEVLTLKYKF